MSVPEPAFLYCQVPTGDERCSEFRLTKTIDLTTRVRFPRTGHSQIFSNLRNYLEQQPYMFIMGSEGTSAYNASGCISVTRAPYGKGLAINDALPTCKVEEQQGSDFGIMATDSVALFYDASDMCFLACLHVPGMPIGVPMEQRCSKTEFLATMQGVRKAYIDAVVSSSRLCLTARGWEATLKWKLQNEGSNPHMRWKVSPVDFIVQERLHIHAFPRQKLRTFLYSRFARGAGCGGLRNVARSNKIVRLIASMYWAMVGQIPAGLCPPEAFFAAPKVY